MPLAFPCHQGLIAPLWRRWPHRFNALACCVGAAAPDIVDGLIGIARGRLGQGIGHSIIGLFALCVPVGFGVTAMIRTAASRAGWNRVAGKSPSLAIEAWSLWIGAFSHALFDFISHENFLWLYPWYDNPEFFPLWWRERWLEVALPFYAAPYPIGPHFVVWMILNVVGAVMFLPSFKR